MDQQQATAILKQLQLKVTPKRLEVMSCLGAESRCLSADDVWQSLKPAFNRIGLPTVYRILDELVLAGVVTRIFRSDSKQYYYLCANQEHHHHFVCENCRRVQDVHHCGLDAVTRDLVHTCGAQVTSHILQINGICAQCQQQQL